MRVIDLERPNAPLEYLAIYLLKNQDKVTLPPKLFSKTAEEGQEGEAKEALVQWKRLNLINLILKVNTKTKNGDSY